MAGLRARLRDARRYRNLHLLRRALDAHRNLSVLDVGGGTGRVVAGLDVPRSVVADPDRGLLAAAPEKDLGAVQADATDLPFADGAFDRIVAVRTLHHVAEPETALVEFKRVLADDGRMVIEEVLPRSLFGRVLATVEGLTGNVAFVEPIELKELLERVGMECKIEQWSPRDYAAVAVPEGTREPPERPGALA